METKIVPFLMFKNEAEQAVKFYVSLFPNSKIVNITHYTETEMRSLSRLPPDIRPGPVGSVRSITFILNGQKFYAANGGSYFEFNHGISLYVNCETKEELDTLWSKLALGGTVEECGWLRDKFGISWQIAPAFLEEMMNDKDEKKYDQVSVEILTSKKLDFEKLKHLMRHPL